MKPASQLLHEQHLQLQYIAKVKAISSRCVRHVNEVHISHQLNSVLIQNNQTEEDHLFSFRESKDYLEV